MRDLLIPRTDTGVATQVATVLLTAGALVILLRRERPLVLPTLGVASMLLGLMGLRTLH
ncbi:MAG: hypothetical protein KatS3mg010_0884 [Acidimicrobiia bacterium]|nr:MAG: hypothetical protein KatS3mg010_0884 [Acidimicrobiia bacterium]